MGKLSDHLDRLRKLNKKLYQDAHELELLRNESRWLIESLSKAMEALKRIVDTVEVKESQGQCSHCIAQACLKELDGEGEG